MNWASTRDNGRGRQCDQEERERKRRHEADLTDVLIASIALGEALKMPAPRVVETDGIDAFSAISSAQDCVHDLTHAEYQLDRRKTP